MDEVGKELDLFSSALDASADLRRLVSSPAFSRREQDAAIGAILKKMQIGGITANFAGLLVKNGRLDHFAPVIRAYHDLLAEHHGEITAEVSSAQKLNADQLKDLRAALKKLSGRKTRIIQHIDETLLGGLVVKLGSRMYDSSLRTKLFNLQRLMKEVG